MKVCTALIEDIFLNDKRLDHCGVLICQRLDGFTKIIIPGPGYGSKNRFTLQFKDEGGEGKKPGQQGIQFFANHGFEEKKIFGVIYTENGTPNILTISLSLERSICAGEDAGDTLLFFDEDYAHERFFEGVNLKREPMENMNWELDDLVDAFKAYPNDRISSLFNLQYYRMKINMEPPKNGLAVFTYYRDYFQPYANFLSKHPNMTNKECENFVRTLGNFPKFVRETLKFDLHDGMYQVVADFLRFHVCGFAGCGGFSFHKCSQCNTIHYCNATCQRKAFHDHEKTCENWMKKRKVRFCVPSHLHDIMSSPENKDPVSMEVFMREIMWKAYAIFHDELSKGERSIHVQAVFLCMKKGGYGKNPPKEGQKELPYYNLNKMGHMLKKKMNLVRFDQVFKQMEEIYEENWKEDRGGNSLMDDIRDWMMFLRHGPFMDFFGLR